MTNALAQDNEPGPIARRTPRTHLFVVATLYSNGGSCPVHIRNMSPSGAMIEASVIPDVGERVIVRRGSLQVAGTIKWKAGRKAGLSFEALIFVDAWMAKLSSDHQDRVDSIVSSLKAGVQPPSRPAAEQLPGYGSPLLEAELTLLRTELSRLGEKLAVDVILAATHPEIQLLDIALQRVERMLKAVQAER